MTMMLDWRRLLLEITRRMWFRASLMVLLAIALALMGLVIEPWLPDAMRIKVSESPLTNLLETLASSMLLVVTFSLATVVTAYAAATSNATPRAINLLVEDRGVQRTLAGFIGAFVFSVVALLALSTGAYNAGGKLVLLALTALVMLGVVVLLLRWIDNVSRLGQVSQTIARAETVTREAMRDLARAPFFGALPYDAPPDSAAPLPCERVGHVTFIDAEKLQSLCEEHDLRLWCEVTTGEFVTPGQPVARLSKAVHADLADTLSAAFSIEPNRSFDQDPCFGLIVLTEMAQRALSPAVNDPGTAIDVIGAVTRLLCGWADARRSAPEPSCPYDRLFVRPLNEADFFDKVYGPLARDCAGMIEVISRMQLSLARLGQLGYAPFVEPARHQAQRALRWSDENVFLEEDRAQLRHIANWAIDDA